MPEFDASDLSKLAADVGTATIWAEKYLRKALEVTARHVRDTARENATGLAHAPAFPYSISYDVGATGAEIGPDKSRAQGALGNLLEYGSRNNAPLGIMHGALQANEEDFERGVTRAIDDALKAAGL